MVKFINSSTSLSLLLITFIATITYLPLTPFLGFYSDDFFFGYVSHFYGAEGLIKSLSIDRPYHAYLLTFLYHTIGLRDNILLWHLYVFLVRLLGGYIFFLLLRLLWPKQFAITTLTTLVFITYPGFLQQTLPLGFAVWITNLPIYLLSLYFTLLSLNSKFKARNYLFTSFGLLLQTISFIQLEFFIGLEAFRYLLITYKLKGRISPSSLKNSLPNYLPYLATTTIFILWRIFIFESTRDITNIGWVTQTYYSNPIWIIKVPFEFIYSFFTSLVLAYILPLLTRIPRLSPLEALLSFSIAAASSLLVFFYLLTSRRNNFLQATSNESKKFAKVTLAIGLISTLFAIIPIILSGRMVRLVNVFDRYTITAVIPISLALVAFTLLFLHPKVRNITLTLIIAASIMIHLSNGYLFKSNWQQQKQIWWQLYWRAPSISPNTMLVVYFPKLASQDLKSNIINQTKWNRIYWVDYQIWAPGNFFFNYNSQPSLHFQGEFLNDSGIGEKIKNGVKETITDRNITYQKNFANSLITTMPNDQSCLWVLDSQTLETPENFPKELDQYIPYSNTKQLLNSNNLSSPPTMFYPQPSHSWCYYFQKASYYRQLGNWEQVLNLKAESEQKGLTPKDPNEWLPFIEAYLALNKNNEASELINLQKSSETFKSNLLKMLQRLQINAVDINFSI